MTCQVIYKYCLLLLWFRFEFVILVPDNIKDICFVRPSLLRTWLNLNRIKSSSHDFFDKHQYLQKSKAKQYNTGTLQSRWSLTSLILVLRRTIQLREVNYKEVKNYISSSCRISVPNIKHWSGPYCPKYYTRHTSVYTSTLNLTNLGLSFSHK